MEDLDDEEDQRPPQRGRDDGDDDEDDDEDDGQFFLMISSFSCADDVGSVFFSSIRNNFVYLFLQLLFSFVMMLHSY